MAPHIHDAYDFVVSAFIVFQEKVLLIHHKRYDRWLPIGGHIELDEDPEQALYREIKEECGLEVEILATKPDIAHPGVKPILTPNFVDVHEISETHKHTAFVYFAKSTNDQVVLHEQEHYEYAWLSESELEDKKYNLIKSIKFYCQQALLAARNL